MSDLEETIKLAKAEKFDDVEDRWLSHLSEHPSELDFFLTVADRLIAYDEEERTQFLLDLLEEQLKEIEDWSSLLRVLRKTGLIFRDPSELHAEALEAIKKLYAGSPSLDFLIDKVGLLRAIEDTPKIWKKIDRLQSLMQFDEGAVVWMQDKGAGRVVEVNFDLESFKLELEHHPGLRVGFAAAPKMLKPLPEGHFLRRKIEDPEGLRDLAQSEPGETLLALLRSADEPLGASEIKLLMGSLVPSAKWTSWWAEARKHPQVLSSGSSARQKYSWASSTDDARDAVRQTFDSADLDQRLTIYRKEARRSPELAEHMSEQLARQADAALEANTATALVIWNTLERNGAASAVEWSPRAIVEKTEGIASVIAEVPDRALRERLYELAVKVHPEWPSELAKALRLEEDPRLLSSIAHRLAEHDRDRLESALEDLTGKPRRYASAFVWLVENASEDLLVENRNPLRLLRQVFDAFHQPEFNGFRNRLAKTLEGPAADAMLRRLDEDQAKQAKQAITRAPIDGHIRENLERALEFRFPSLDEKEDLHFYATAESIEARRTEMKKLIEIEIPANRKAIEEARELGDLRENFEYKSARQRHEYLNARVEGLQRDLERVRPFDQSKVNTEEIRLGSSFVLRNKDAKELSLTIMGPWESDPDQGVISYASDLGQNLLGLKIGDSVDLEDESYEISTIGSYGSE